MADQQQTAGKRGEPLLEPFDRRNVEMVGRLVQKQDIGLGHQGRGEADPPALAAGKIGEQPIALDADLVQGRRDEMTTVGVSGIARQAQRNERRRR